MDDTVDKSLTTVALMFNFAGQKLEPYLLQVFRKCLDENPDIKNERESSSSGNTLLHVAVSHRNLEVVKILVDRGADLNVKNNDGETPIEIAENQGNERNEILSLLKKRDKRIETSEEDTKEDEIQNLELDVENDALSDVKRKLGLYKDSNLKTATIQQINELNIVHRFLEKGKYEIVDLFLSLKGTDVQKENDVNLTLADITYKEKKYVFLVKLLDKDSKFPKEFDPSEIDESAEGAKDLQELIRFREELHEAIGNGDLQLVQQLSKEFKSRACVNLKNQSALATSLIEKQAKIYAFFVNLGMRFIDGKERYYNDWRMRGADNVRHLEEYFERSEESPLFRVLESYRVCGESSEEKDKVFQGMFQRMFDSKLLRPLLKVLQFEKFEIIFDLNSDLTDRICPSSGPSSSGSSSACRGLTKLEENRCYIGAKKCFSSQSKEIEVFRTLVHELCHLTVNFLYENWGLPYRKNEEDKKKKYQEIVQVVDQKIREAFSNAGNDKLAQLYEIFVTRKEGYTAPGSWETEVIVRCCEIIAQYGDKVGEELLENEVPELMNFYRSEFLQDCEEYSRFTISTKWDSLAYDLSLNHGGLLRHEREHQLFEKIPVSVEDYLLPAKVGGCDSIKQGGSDEQFNVFFLRTDNVYLSKMHVYQELKEKHKFHVDRKCLFFEYNYFYENLIDIGRELIRFEEVVIVQQHKAVIDLYDLIKSLKRAFCKLGKRTIIIVDKDIECSIPDWPIGPFITYDWGTISRFWKSRIYGKEIKFQGRVIPVDKLFGKIKDKIVIPSNLLSRIMAGLPIGDDEFSKTNVCDEILYMKRYLVRKRLENFPENLEGIEDFFFLTGIDRDELIGLGFQESKIKTLAFEDCENDESKQIILPAAKKEAEKIFRRFCKKNVRGKKIHWIHRVEKEFYHFKSDGSGKDHLTFQEEMFFEGELVSSAFIRKTRLILITDEPGSGKSTILVKLCKLVKESTPSTLVLKSTFNDIFSEYQKRDDLRNVFKEKKSEEIINFFINSMCKGDPALKEIFRELDSKPNGVSLFLDGLDELHTKHIGNAVHLLKELKLKTSSQLWISSRTSHSEQLLMELETVPYTLQLWDDNVQRDYLCKLWCNSLTDYDLPKAREKICEIVEPTTQDQESIESPIQHLIIELKKLLHPDAMVNSTLFSKALRKEIFYDFATYTLRNVNFSHKFKFLGIPLHVFMLGNVLFNANFRFMVCSNAFSLFSIFVEQKIDIFLREKCKLCYENDYTEVVVKERKKSIEADHKIIAKHTLGSGNLDFLSPKHVRGYDYLNAVGLVKVKENEFTFFHKTCEEYFYSASIFEDMANGNPNGSCLSRIISDPELHAVKVFVNGALEEALPETSVESKFFTDFNLREAFTYLCDCNRDEDVLQHCIWIWKYVISKFESQEDELMTKTFISSCKSDLEQQVNNELNKWKGLQLLLSFQKEKFTTFIFELNELFFVNVILSSFEYCSTDYLDLILRNIACYISQNSNCGYCKRSKNSQVGLKECGDHSVDCLRDRLVNELFQKKDRFDRSIVMFSSENEDANVFQKTVDFAKGMSVEYKNLLKAKDDSGGGMLHCKSRRKAKNIMKILNILESHMEKDEIHEMLTSKDDYDGAPDLWSVIEHWENDGMNEFLSYFRKLLSDDDSYRNVLLVQNKNRETILHLVLTRKNFIPLNGLVKEVFKLLDIHSVNGKEEFVNWIETKDRNGYNIATCAAISLNNEKMKGFLENLRTLMNDDKTYRIIAYEGIMLCKEFATNHRKKYNDLALMTFDHILSLIPDDHSSLNELLMERLDDFGSNFIGIASLGLGSGNVEILMKNLRNIYHQDRNSLKKILFITDNEGNTIFHNACVNKDESVFSLFCDEVIELFHEDKEELVSLMTRANDNELNVVTNSVIDWKSEKLTNFIDELKKTQILDSGGMRKLFFQVDVDCNTVLHNSSRNSDHKVLVSVFDEIINLCDGDEEELISFVMKRNRRDQIVVCHAVRHWKLERISSTIDELKKSESEIRRLNGWKRLLFVTDKCRNTILINASMNKNHGVFGLVFDEITKLFNEDKEEMINLIMKGNIYGENIVTHAAKDFSSEKMAYLIGKLKKSEILDLSEMKKLFCETDAGGNTVLHNVCKNRSHKVFGVVFGEIVKLLNEYRDELVSFIMKSNCHGETLFHSMNFNRKNVNELGKLRECVGKEKTRELLLELDKKGKTCFQKNGRNVVFSEKFKENILSLSKWVDKSDMKKLLLLKNVHGKSFYDTFSGEMSFRTFVADILSEETFENLPESESEELSDE